MIDQLQEFLLELGKGFSFVARQKQITTEGGQHYYIDLVFYNYLLKCFVVIDLKAGELSYQDIGQIDFYTRLFDDKDNLFASKYKTWLPTEEELKLELQRERALIERSFHYHQKLVKNFPNNSKPF